MNQQPLPDSLYAGPRPGARGPFNARNPLPNDDPMLRANGRNDSATEPQYNRAARYEDEKRRIIESCFAKKEEDGVAAESYITHVRVIEDASSPSAPPSPDSTSVNKKSRVILVSVKKNGRVRVHKARENPTGTFSIGKTWNLDDLSGIQSYTNLIPRSHEEELHKEWANGVGFIVTLQKAYYWQAPTAKEKDFFIGSLVKIYRKYTGGKLPELFGFASQEVEMLTGVPVTPNLSAQIQTPPLSAQPISPPPPIPASYEQRNQSPLSFRSQGSDQTGRARAQSRSEQPPPSRDVHRPPPIEPLRSPMRSEERQPGQDTWHRRPSDVINNSQIPDQLVAGPAYSQFAHSRSQPSAQSSQQSLPSEKLNGRMPNGTSRPPQPLYLESLSGPVAAASGGSRPSTAKSDQRSLDARSEHIGFNTESPPDRKKLLTGKTEVQLASRSGAASETNSQFATPAATPSELHLEKVPDFPLIGHPQTPAAIATQQDSINAGKDGLGGIDATDPAREQSKVAEVNSVVADSESVSQQKKPEEDHRPGLGPMVKKKSAKDIANQFRRVALAAAAFQPRQGGAGARLKAMQDKDNVLNEPDGITSVVPAPLFRGMSGDSVKSPSSTTPTTTLNQDSPLSLPIHDREIKIETRNGATEVTASQVVPALPVIQAPAGTDVEVQSPSPEKTRSRSPERKKRQRQEADISRYCSALGIDPQIFHGRGAEFNDLLTEFGWEGRLGDHQRVEDLETDIKRDIGRAQATGWLGHVEQQESKVQDLAKAFDKAIEECEELDGLFTLYSHELDTLAADIEYIEAQSQGLQVQTANQKLLQNELNNLLRTLTISSSDLRSLQSGSLDTEAGVDATERSLASLYKALLTIDPDIRQNKIRQTVNHSHNRGGVGVYADTEIGQMRAVLEKKAHYQNSAMAFVRRFNQHISTIFKAMDDETLVNERQRLWQYNAMMLFVREVNSFEWQTLISSYEINLKGTYQAQFRDFAMNQRKLIRKPGPEELEALFTTQEREKTEENLASTAARKLTVKRGKTVKASALRTQLGEKRDGKLDAYEVFANVLQHQANIISEEQNFVVSFFHLNSQASADFAEIVSLKPPNQRKLPSLKTKQSYDPDRNMAKIVQGVIEGIYSFWLGDLQNLLDWALGLDALQGVGVLVALEKCLATFEETNQEHIVKSIRTMHERLTGMFQKFVDEQIRAIEDTKVKVKKRKGVISFMRTFPLFSAVIEQMMPPDTISGSAPLEIRFIVDQAYGKVLKSMWESLSFIAKDDSTIAGGGLHSVVPGSGDLEDKEALNYHILLIENMNHYLEEVDTLKNIVLQEWADRARHDFSTHLSQYTDSVIRRPLGKWLDFVESTEAMMKNSDNGGVTGKPSHSRSVAKKVLSSYDSKEIKKGIETLKKRIEKHFSDVDDPTAANKALVARVFDECNLRYMAAHSRMQVIIEKLFDNNLEIEFRKEEVSVLFKR